MKKTETDYDEKRLEQLLDLMADEQLSDENIDELQDILLNSEEARQKYINFNFVDDSLHWSYAEAALDIGKFPHSYIGFQFIHSQFFCFFLSPLRNDRSGKLFPLFSVFRFSRISTFIKNIKFTFFEDNPTKNANVV